MGEDIPVGKQFGEYQVLRPIGEGGMGNLFLARNVNLPDLLAVLKILKTEEQRDRFLREASILSRFDHPNICQIRTFFQQDDMLILVIQYVDGQTLGQLVTEKPDTSMEEIKAIFVQVLSGLAYAHSFDIAHRDIKPSNIMIDRSGTVKIIDFGVAHETTDVRLTSEGISVGTPQYMAPEQFEKGTHDYRLSDIYSLGICMYRAFCGRVPFEDTNPIMLWRMHSGEEPIRPSKLNPRIGYQLEKVILKAMQKKPDRRYKSAKSMRDALITSGAEAAEPTQEVRERAARRRISIRLGFAAILVLIVAAGYLYFDDLVKLVNSRPRITVSSQTIQEGDSFAPLTLIGLAAGNADLDTANWSAHGNGELLITIDTGVISLLPPNHDWYGVDTIWFVARAGQTPLDSVFAVFTVTSINDAPVIGDSIARRIQVGDSFSPIDLDDLVEDADDADSLIEWTFAEPENLYLSIDEERSLFVSPVGDWTGKERIEFTATDPGGASGRTTMSFEVVEKRSEPVSPSVIVRVIPTDVAALMIDGRKAEVGKLHEVRPGEHDIKIVHPDYPILAREVLVSKPMTEVTFNLTEEFEALPEMNLMPVIFPPSDDHQLSLSLNGKVSLYEEFPVLGVSFLPGEYRVETKVQSKSLNLAKKIVIDSCVVNPFGSGPRAVLAGSKGSLMLMNSSPNRDVRLFVYWRAISQ